MRKKREGRKKGGKGWGRRERAGDEI